MCHPSQGNHKKATKLLLMAVQNRGQNGDQQQNPPPTVESLNVSDPYVMSLYHNNLGCINMATGRPNAARFNLHYAINLHNTATTAGGGGRMVERQESCISHGPCLEIRNKMFIHAIWAIWHKFLGSKHSSFILYLMESFGHRKEKDEEYTIVFTTN